MRCSSCNRNSLMHWGFRLAQLVLAMTLALGLIWGAMHAADVEDSEPTYRPSFDGWQGVEAPELEITFLDGEVVALSELRGKRVVLDFWATWCPPCVEEIPHFNELTAETSADDLLIIGISDEDEETLEAFIADQGVDYPIASMDFLISPYGDVQTVPTTFFIDRNGIIQTVVSGYHDLDDLRALATAPDYAGDVKSPPQSTEINAKDGAGHTRLTHAAMAGDADAVRALIADGADIETGDEDERTPLLYAAKNGHAETVRVLLDNGAETGAQDYYEMDPLFFAARNGRTEVVRLLLEHGADPDTENYDGATPLSAASHQEYEEIVAFLEPALAAGH